LDDGAGPLTVSRETTATFNIVSQAGSLDGQTSFSFASGSATLNAISSTVYEVRLSGNASAIYSQESIAAAVTLPSWFTVGSSDAAFSAKSTVNCHTGVSTATVSYTLNWTDTSGTAQSHGFGPVTCTTLGAASFGQSMDFFRAQAGSTVGITTSVANSPVYDMSVVLTPETTN